MTKKSDIFCKPWLKDLGGGGFLDFYGCRGKNQTTNRLIIAPQSFIKMCVCVPTLSRCAPYCQAWHLDCQENFRTKKTKQQRWRIRRQREKTAETQLHCWKLTLVSGPPKRTHKTIVASLIRRWDSHTIYQTGTENNIQYQPNNTPRPAASTFSISIQKQHINQSNWNWFHCSVFWEHHMFLLPLSYCPDHVKTMSLEDL